MPNSPRFPADKGRSYKVIEQEAASVRSALGLPPSGPVSALACMRRLRSLFVGKHSIPVAYGTMKLEPGVEGETYYNVAVRRLEIMLSEPVYIGLDNDVGEQSRPRFSFFHELGHAALHSAELVRLSRIPKSQAEAFMRANYPKVADYRNVEWQANAFAGCFMMPALSLEELRAAKKLNVSEICRRFNTSLRSSEIRLGVFLSRRLELLEES